MSAAPVAANRKRLRTRFYRLLISYWPLIFTPVSLALISAAKRSPYAVERLYSSGLYRYLSRTFSYISSIFPFSLAEFGGIALMIFAVVLAFRAVREAVRKAARAAASGEPHIPPGKRRLEVMAGCIAGWLGFLAKLASIVLFIFVVSCGLNYYRPEFAELCGLEVRQSTVAELELLCTELAQRANALREQLPEDENGVMTGRLSSGFRETARLACEAFGRLSEDCKELPDMPIVPKPVINSWAMSQLQLTGVFTFITYESNVNFNSPTYSLPATMCHELAHTRGFMREDEANFIGYLACEKSSVPEFTYSGVMLALTHAENWLYASDREAFERVDALISDGVRRDFRYSNSYWAQFEGPAAKVSEAVNNAYLKANDQTDGTRSYGRMVDLLLADYRARHSIGC